MAGSRDGTRAGAAAVELRVSGASFADIAVTLALSSATEALRLVERELGTHLSSDDIEIARAEASERILGLLSSLWDKANDSGDPEHLPAARMALALVDRHIRLHGLDKPAQIEVYTPLASEVDRVLAQIVTATMPTVVEADVIGEPGAIGP